jgi:hypothetical protein
MVEGGSVSFRERPDIQRYRPRSHVGPLGCLPLERVDCSKEAFDGLNPARSNGTVGRPLAVTLQLQQDVAGIVEQLLDGQ